MSTIPAWRFPHDLDKTCARYRRKYSLQRSRPRYSLPQIRNAAYRYDRSISGELSWVRVFIAVLYFYVQLKRGDIVAIVGIQHPRRTSSAFARFS